MAVYEPKLLRVNLTSGAVKEEVIPEKVIMDFVGGRGIGIKYLYQELTLGIDPLGAENKLLFIIGPLAGTGAQSSSRWMVSTKSPLTGTYTRAVGGGDFGAWLRFAGLDMIIVEGKAAKPVYLYMKDGRYEIRDAGKLWGQNTAETQERLREIHGRGVRIACIGPAGEKLVRYANVMSDRRSASRGGVGTVMGSKNLKAIVIDAARKVRLPEWFKELIKQQVASFKAHRSFEVYREMGTEGTDLTNIRGMFPTRNFREGSLEGWENISQKEYAKIKVKDTACYACMVRCGKVHRVESGPYAGVTNEGPEYESAWAFTGPIASTDIGATVAADALCDDLGIDTISAGVSIGFAYELFEKGILGLKETDGLSLTYGNFEAAIELIKRIGNRQGLGNILAEGVKRAALRIGKGSEAYAMHVKGLELPGYESRGAKRHGLGYVTSNVGANHNIGYVMREFSGPRHARIDRFADEGNTDLLKLSQDRCAMFETGIMCLFTSLDGMLPASLFAEMLASATGIPDFGSEEYLLKVGERIYNLERIFNLREGFSRKDDAFPLRMTTEPLKNAGPAEGQIIGKPEVLLDEYYQFRGWDKNGVPTPEKLEELGLGEVSRNIR